MTRGENINFKIVIGMGIIIIYLLSTPLTLVLASDFPVEFSLLDWPESTFYFSVDLLADRDREIEIRPWSSYYEAGESSPIPSAWNKKGVPVILVHGFQTSSFSDRDYEKANKLAFEQLVRRIVIDDRISAHDVRLYGCIWPTKTNSLEENGRLLREAIERTDDLKYRDDIIIIAHSMGGLVARSYIEQQGGEKNVQRLITLGTPHQGVSPAVVYDYFRSSRLESFLDLISRQPLRIFFPGIRDTFATRDFYEVTNFAKTDQDLNRDLFSNQFLEDLNLEFSLYEEKYHLAAGDIAGDETTMWRFNWRKGVYGEIVNDGLVAKYSALAGKDEGMIKKTSHSSITEDKLVVDEIIEEISSLLYYFHLEKEEFIDGEELRVEVWKKVNQKQKLIETFKVALDDFSEQGIWSSKQKAEVLTTDGIFSSARLGLGGENLIKVYEEKEEEAIKVFKVSEH